jgi:hypothetical protein
MLKKWSPLLKKFDLTYSDEMQTCCATGYRRIKTRLLPGPVDEDKQREQRDFIERYFNARPN